MANIMNLLNNRSVNESVEDDSYEAPAQDNSVRPAVLGDPNIDAMRKILESMQRVQESPVEPVVRVRDVEIEEALETEPTERGVAIGDWEIVCNEGRTKTYDVVSESGTVIARGLYLYEAALGLVRRLNEGMAINDKPIRDLLVLEENFARARNDAVSYRQRSQNLHAKGDTKRALVAEDRFDRAQTEALSAHDEILRLAGIRR
jgi:hypothetical protein